MITCLASNCPCRQNNNYKNQGFAAFIEVINCLKTQQLPFSQTLLSFSLLLIIFAHNSSFYLIRAFTISSKVSNLLIAFFSLISQTLSFQDSEAFSRSSYSATLLIYAASTSFYYNYYFSTESSSTCRVSFKSLLSFYLIVLSAFSYSLKFYFYFCLNFNFSSSSYYHFLFISICSLSIFLMVYFCRLFWFLQSFITSQSQESEDGSAAYPVFGLYCSSGVKNSSKICFNLLYKSYIFSLIIFPCYWTMLLNYPLGEDFLRLAR